KGWRWLRCGVLPTPMAWTSWVRFRYCSEPFMDPMPIVVPVRFSGGGLSMQTTSSRMTLEAVFVRCLVAPKQGAEISLQITLPEDVLPVQIKGTVTETVPIGSKGKEAGFWAKLGADPRLEAFLRKKAGLAPVVRPPPQAAPVVAA